eukprot:TRINITY_DN3787_c0_g1_i1.p1 TRINITY_DN3787_c0_g1~~TRINITY_DN3787_c0_g1_i1.p1  ORF type:complete len:210 (-),score=42.76 TRINITY_DN3787_c0_g1_i1:152-781(-)
MIQEKKIKQITYNLRQVLKNKKIKKSPFPRQWYLSYISVSYTHLRAHETRHDLVCRLLLEKKKKKKKKEKKEKKEEKKKRKKKQLKTQEVYKNMQQEGCQIRSTYNRLTWKKEKKVVENKSETRKQGQGQQTLTINQNNIKQSEQKKKKGDIQTKKRIKRKRKKEKKKKKKTAKNSGGIQKYVTGRMLDQEYLQQANVEEGKKGSRKQK